MFDQFNGMNKGIK